ncbi:MAG: hypothetical protein JWP57_4386 [Spirosoma sp.]|nr:hypothetical protein [Spirosoma sp.]
MDEQPALMVWDEVSVADTRPALTIGGIPIYGLLGAFFLPAVVAVLTFNILWMLTVPLIITLLRALYADNANRAFELVQFFASGSAWADWRAWGGESPDPHGNPKIWNGMQ